MQLKENTMFANRYQLERLLGRGGFSEVWLAKDSYTKLNIAIKVYAPGQGMDSDGLQEFSQELAGVFNLNQTNLLKPTHVDSWEGMPYLIMAYCSQGSLTKRIGKMSEQDIWHVIHDVAAGLAYLHKNDIVHQDIKPDNILIDEVGNYVITDFGISTKARSTLRKSVIGGSLSGGTMAYMGPERFSRQPAPTKASDIWSFGAMVFELITGNVPFGEMGGGMQKGGAEIPEITEPISDMLRQTIESMLALETWDRPTAEQLIKARDAQPAPAAKEVKAEPQPEPTSRATQRFVETSSVETKLQSVKEENATTEVANEGKWRWLPILEAVLLVPCMLNLIICASINIAYDLWFAAGYLSCLGILLGMASYYFLLEQSIAGATSKKKTTGIVLIVFIAIEILVILLWDTSETSYIIIEILYTLICITIWFIFQKRIPASDGNSQKRKLFSIILSILYVLIVCWTALTIMAHKEEADKANQTAIIEDNTDSTSQATPQLSYKEQCEKFLEENKYREGVITTNSGLQYEVIKMGTGKKPTLSSRVKVHYEGSLIDGTLSDGSCERGEPVEFDVNNLIEGWKEGLQLMPVGSVFKFYIPYNLAYGDQEVGSIPPYSTVIFKIELLDVIGQKHSDEVTVQASTNSTRKICGAHKLRIQWLEPEMGNINISDKKTENGYYGYGAINASNGYLKIEGYFVMEDANNITFTGSIEQSVSYIEDGKVGNRNGVYHFKSYNGRKYWRMQEMSNPVGEYTDYIDIFF